MEIKLLLTFSFAFSILIGCSKASEDSNDLAKLAHSQMSHGEAEMVVAERKEIFEQLVKACEKYPSLRSVGPEDGRERLYKTSGEPSKEFNRLSPCRIYKSWDSCTYIWWNSCDTGGLCPICNGLESSNV
jgi:hypothetical protein